MRKNLILAGGITNLLFALFHLFLPRLLDWENTLATLSADNRGTMYTFNIQTTLVLVAFGVLSLLYWSDLLTPGLGKTLALFIGGFWLLRAAAELVYYQAPSPVLFIVCLVITALYAAAVLPATRSHPTSTRPL